MSTQNISYEYNKEFIAELAEHHPLSIGTMSDYIIYVCKDMQCNECVMNTKCSYTNGNAFGHVMDKQFLPQLIQDYPELGI